MAFPVYQFNDEQEGTQTSNATLWTGTYPTNLVSGDLILLIVSSDGSGVASATGFTATSASNGTANTETVLRKVSDGTETGTFTITISASEQGCWKTARITNWFGTLADGFAINTATTGSNAVPDPGSLTPAWGAADTLWIAVAGWDGTPTWTGTAWTNYTSEGGQSSGGAGGAGQFVARRDNNTASEDPGGAGGLSGSETWVSYTLGIRPAAAPDLRVPRSTPYPQLLGH